MLKKTLMMAALTAALAGTTGFALAADQPGQSPGQSPGQATGQTEDRIYGSQLMTPDERDQYDQQIQSAKTDEEREQIREQHRERMRERARERGVTLPGDQPAKGSSGSPGSGMRPGGGMGGGGMGGGMGGGGGRRN